MVQRYSGACGKTRPDPACVTPRVCVAKQDLTPRVRDPACARDLCERQHVAGLGVRPRPKGGVNPCKNVYIWALFFRYTVTQYTPTASFGDKPAAVENP